MRLVKHDLCASAKTNNGGYASGKSSVIGKPRLLATKGAPSKEMAKGTEAGTSGKE